MHVEAPCPNRYQAGTARDRRSVKATAVVTVREQSRTHPQPRVHGENPQRSECALHASVDGPEIAGVCIR